MLLSKYGICIKFVNIDPFLVCGKYYMFAVRFVTIIIINIFITILVIKCKLFSGLMNALFDLKSNNN